MTDEKHWLLCIPALGEKRSLYLPGTSFTHECSQCAQKVIVAPSSIKLLAARHDIEIICSQCFEGLKPGDVVRFAPGLGEEIAQAKKRDAH